MTKVEATATGSCARALAGLGLLLSLLISACSQEDGAQPQQQASAREPDADRSSRSQVTPTSAADTTRTPTAPVDASLRGAPLDAAVAPMSMSTDTDAGLDCEHPPEEIDVEAFPTCEQCERARCVPRELVPTHEANLLGECDERRVCVPEALLRTNGVFVPRSCHSLGGAEGRCVSVCVPQVAAQAERLPQDNCVDDERCTPCFEPTTGEPTEACNLSCDPGPTEAPLVFDACCEDRGTCVPSTLAGDAAQSLPTERCDARDGERYVCAPNEKVQDSTYQFPDCTTAVDCSQAEDDVARLGCESGGLGLVALADQPGACVPACVLAERNPTAGIRPSKVYQQSSCGTGEICAPCEIPTVGSSGVCD